MLNCYIDSKAAALGVNKSEILNRLSENYSVKDIEKKNFESCKETYTSMVEELKSKYAY